jgi:hypothetical protein
MEAFISNSGFDSIGDFLQVLFYNPTRVAGKEDPHGVAHGLAVARFLQGKTNIKLEDVRYYCPHLLSQKQCAVAIGKVNPLPRASCSFLALSLTWATNLVGNHVHQEIHKLTVKNNDSHLHASSNG